MELHQHLYDGDGWKCVSCGECRCSQHEIHIEPPPLDGQAHWQSTVGSLTQSLIDQALARPFIEQIVAALIEHDLVEEQPIGDLLRALRGER